MQHQFLSPLWLIMPVFEVPLLTHAFLCLFMLFLALQINLFTLLHCLATRECVCRKRAKGEVYPTASRDDSYHVSCPWYSFFCMMTFAPSPVHLPGSSRLPSVIFPLFPGTVILSFQGHTMVVVSFTCTGDAWRSASLCMVHVHGSAFCEAFAL